MLDWVVKRYLMIDFRAQSMIGRCPIDKVGRTVDINFNFRIEHGLFLFFLQPPATQSLVTLPKVPR